MGRKPNDGRGQLGGRAKGTPNKSKAYSREYINGLLSEYVATGYMHNDFHSLDPRDRLTIAEKLMQYVTPKLQATSVDIQATQKTKIEDMLAELLDE